MQVEKVNASLCDFFNRFLAMKKGAEEYRRDCQITSLTVLLPNNYSADFNLVNGDKESGPYLDVILYEGGHEVQTLDPTFEKLEGVYNLKDLVEDREFVLKIERQD